LSLLPRPGPTRKCLQESYFIHSQTFSFPDCLISTRVRDCRSLSPVRSSEKTFPSSFRYEIFVTLSLLKGCRSLLYPKPGLRPGTPLSPTLIVDCPPIALYLLFFFTLDSFIEQSILSLPPVPFFPRSPLLDLLVCTNYRFCLPHLSPASFSLVHG